LRTTPGRFAQLEYRSETTATAVDLLPLRNRKYHLPGIFSVTMTRFLLPSTCATREETGTSAGRTNPWMISPSSFPSLPGRVGGSCNSVRAHRQIHRFHRDRPARNLFAPNAGPQSRLRKITSFARASIPPRHQPGFASANPNSCASADRLKTCTVASILVRMKITSSSRRPRFYRVDPPPNLPGFR